MIPAVSRADAFLCDSAPNLTIFAMADRSIAPARLFLLKKSPGRKVRATKGTMLPNGKSGESLKPRNRK